MLWLLFKPISPHQPLRQRSYPLKPGKEVSVIVDSKRFPFFAEGNHAWTENVADEARLVSAMRAGKTLKVQATSARGTQTRYSFSLMGLSAALQRVNRCP
ncbi:hypothetical protein GRP92_03680 [Brucella melitensis]|nr:hypothetical protein [Brucella melitensis]